MLVKCDFDRTQLTPSLPTTLAKLGRAGFRPRWLRETVSPSGKGRHWLISLEPTPRSPVVVVALQAILGSDPYRESHNLRRALAYRQQPTLTRRMWNVLYEA